MENVILIVLAVLAFLGSALGTLLHAHARHRNAGGERRPYHYRGISFWVWLFIRAWVVGVGTLVSLILLLAILGGTFKNSLGRVFKRSALPAVHSDLHA